MLIARHVTTILIRYNMGIKFASGTVFYNDCKSLERTLNSLHDKVDLMICVDGKFKHFDDGKDKEGLSTDGSRELVRSYDNAVLLSVPNSYEIQKRTAYLDYCVKVNAEYLLIIDSDEYVYEPETDWFKFKRKVGEICLGVPYNNFNLFGIYTEIYSPNYQHVVHKFTNTAPPALSNPGERKWTYHPRLWHRPYEMEYCKTHFQFRKKDPNSPLHEQEHNATVAVIPHLKLGHDHILRTEAFLESRWKYQAWLVKFEQRKIIGFIKTFGRLPENYDEIDEWIMPSLTTN